MADSPFEETPGASRPPSDSFRFTIGGLLVITAFAALFVAGLFAFPPVISAGIAALMSFCIPAVLVGCLIYGGPGSRAFAIGMLVPKAMQLVSGAFAGMGVSGSSLQMRMVQQQAMLQGRGGAYGSGYGGPFQDRSAFLYFTQMAEYWDQIGHAYMTEEALFWSGSVLAGLTTLWVQRQFARVAHAKEKRIGLHTS